MRYLRLRGNLRARWLLGSTRETPRRFVCLHGGSRFTTPTAARLASTLRASLHDDVVVQPRGSIEEAVRTHRAVFATVPCEHICMGPAFLNKVQRALDLPRRSSDPDTKRPRAALPVAPAIAPGATTAGTLDARDARAIDGSSFDDYALILRGGQRVRIDLRGGMAHGFLCVVLDVELRVFDGDRVLEGDDDSGARLAARVLFTAPNDGAFRVRVMSHGPWQNAGAYRLDVAE